MPMTINEAGQPIKVHQAYSDLTLTASEVSPTVFTWLADRGVSTKTQISVGIVAGVEAIAAAVLFGGLLLGVGPADNTPEHFDVQVGSVQNHR
jgi:hypothetical protein